MRTRLIAALCSLFALAPFAASAQSQSPADRAALEPPPPAAGETQGQDVAPQPQRQNGQVKMPNVPGAHNTAPGEVHTVVKGDTLWDLSESYLGTPWYWPKVWSYNPQIANPHWIYPGNKIRFYPEGAGGEVESASAEMPAPESDAQTEAPEVSTGLEPEQQEGVEVTGKLAYTPSATVQVHRQAFVTSEQVAESGTLTHATTEALMLSPPDLVYVHFKNPSAVKVGAPYLIFHTVKKIDDPVTGDNLGYLTEVLGELKVIRTGPGLATARIVRASRAINRGDRVGPFNEPTVLTVPARPNAKTVRGYVVTALEPYLTIMGENSQMIIDRGSKDGVEPGNTFTVVRQSDPVNTIVNPADDPNPDLPEEDIATCLAVDVTDVATTCLLTRSIKSVVPGDRVVMRPSTMKVGMR